MFDHHHGKLAWGDESGGDYDIKLSEKLYLKAVEELVNKAQAYDLERILLPVGNDFFNSNNQFNMTGNGTVQNEDTRWQKTFVTGYKFIIKGIDYLKQIAPVDVVVVPGNHDPERTFYLGEVLAAWYYRDPNVNVDNSPRLRKYYKYGKCLIGYTHGNNEKIDNLAYIMASEAPELYAETKYREWHLGHFHHKKEIKYISTSEFLGTTIRFMRSLTATDAWHYQKGYVNNVRSAEAFIWDPDNGLVAQMASNL